MLLDGWHTKYFVIVDEQATHDNVDEPERDHEACRCVAAAAGAAKFAVHCTFHEGLTLEYTFELCFVDVLNAAGAELLMEELAHLLRFSNVGRLGPDFSLLFGYKMRVNFIGGVGNWRFKLMRVFFSLTLFLVFFINLAWATRFTELIRRTSFGPFFVDLVGRVG